MPSSYTVDASGRLTLHVNHAGGTYAYPVTADPSISFGWYVYIRYGKDWIRAIWPAQRWSWNIGPALCGWIPKPPWLIVACFAAASAYFTSIRDTFNYAYDNYRCAELRFTYNGWLVGWRSYGC